MVTYLYPDCAGFWFARKSLKDLHTRCMLVFLHFADRPKNKQGEYINCCDLPNSDGQIINHLMLFSGGLARSVLAC